MYHTRLYAFHIHWSPLNLFNLLNSLLPSWRHLSVNKLEQSKDLILITLTFTMFTRCTWCSTQHHSSFWPVQVRVLVPCVWKLITEMTFIQNNQCFSVLNVQWITLVISTSKTQKWASLIIQSIILIHNKNLYKLPLQLI